MDDLVAFLVARQDEAERRAMPGCVGMSGGHPAPEILVCNFGLIYDLPGKPDDWKLDVSGLSRAEQDRAAMEHARTHADKHTLREIAAKRAIIADHADQHECTNLRASEWPYTGCRTLRLLATIDSNHPDYKPEWKP